MNTVSTFLKKHQKGFLIGAAVVGLLVVSYLIYLWTHQPCDITDLERRVSLLESQPKPFQNVKPNFREINCQITIDDDKKPEIKIEETPEIKIEEKIEETPEIKIEETPEKNCQITVDDNDYLADYLTYELSEIA